MPRQKTIKDAAQRLPLGTRKKFYALWESAGVMDLYDGDLGAYFEVIQQVMEAKTAIIDKTAEKLDECKQIIEKL